MTTTKIAEALQTLTENGHYILALVTADDIEHSAKEQGLTVSRVEIANAMRKILMHWDDSADLQNAIDWSLETIKNTKAKQAKIPEVSF